MKAAKFMKIAFVIPLLGNGVGSVLDMVSARDQWRPLLGDIIKVNINVTFKLAEPVGLRWWYAIFGQGSFFTLLCRR